MRILLALSICALIAAPAMAQMETVSFTAVDSQGTSGLASYQATVTGGYTLGDISWSGLAQAIESGTYGSELMVAINGPLGGGTLQLGSGTAYTPEATFSGITDGLAGLGDPAGLWTFDFYESYDDGTAGSPDATWANIEFSLFEYVPPMPAIWYEDFEAGSLPGDWAIVSESGHTGDTNWGVIDQYEDGTNFVVSCAYDPALVDQDNWLISPVATALPTMQLTGLTGGSYYWGGGDPYDNYDVNVWIMIGGVPTIDLGLLDGYWVTNYDLYDFMIDISGLVAVGTDFQVGYQYSGVDGAQALLDNLALRGEVPEPATLSLLAFGALALIRRRR